MEVISHNGHQYHLAVGFRDDETLRSAFNCLTRRVYGFDFEDWYLFGGWSEKYIPYALLQDNEMVSNVSVSIIDFLVDGEQRRFIQIGTVMTTPEKRHQGLNKLLLERVLQDWRGKHDLIYLFANNTVLDFYPKFGFQRIEQWQSSKQIITTDSDYRVTKLDMSLHEHKLRLQNCINLSRPIAQLSMLQNSSLVMFYYTVFIAQNVYLIDELNALVIAEFEGEMMYLQDVYSQHDVALDDVIAALATDTTNRVVLGFTPLDNSDYEVDITIPDDILFVLDDIHGLLTDKKVLFPVMSHA